LEGVLTELIQTNVIGKKIANSFGESIEGRVDDPILRSLQERQGPGQLRHQHGFAASQVLKQLRRKNVARDGVQFERIDAKIAGSNQIRKCGVRLQAGKDDVLLQAT